MNKITTNFLLMLFSLTMQVGCSQFSRKAFHEPASHSKQHVTLKEDLQNLASDKTEIGGISAMRLQILRDTALSVGARGGLAFRAKQQNDLLSYHDSTLSRIFNFSGMLLENNVLPPVLVEARNTLSITGTDVIRIADRNYQILSQARFVTAAPIWRDYLWMGYQAPEAPDKSLLPRNKAEKAVWNKYIDEGWEAGIGQAEAIFKENLARIQRDFEGMIRYRRLLAQNMVSPPYVATLDMGVTGDSSNLTINDRVLRITAFPSLQTDSLQWKTELRYHE